jgi:geranylgeranyl reductase family protein
MNQSPLHSFDADVIVAGAGPAGAVAARTLALAGLDTLLIDRSAFPRNKPCGGGISTRALRRLPWLADALEGVERHWISRLHLEAPDDASFDVESPRPCVMLVRRVELDHALVREAVRGGARFEAGFEITQAAQDSSGVTLQSRDGRRLRARFVVAADGVHSVIGKRLGVNARWPRTHLAIDMMEETPEELLRAERPDVLWVAYAHGGLDGYAYVFPKTRHVNVGIGCLLSHFDTHVDSAPYELQRAFVESLVSRGILHGRSNRECFTPYLIPVGGPLPQTWTGRVVFAGDAGGFVHGITAEGIYYAMLSGELAGRAIAGARDRQRRDAGDRYERLWRSELGAELTDAARLQRYLFAQRSRVARMVRAASASGRLTDDVLQYFRGELPYGALRRRILLRHPLTAVRLARLGLQSAAAEVAL